MDQFEIIDQSHLTKPQPKINIWERTVETLPLAEIITIGMGAVGLTVVTWLVGGILLSL